MKVSLFVTCLVDLLSPQVGTATVTLLRRLGVEVTFNSEQTCCGQPAFNSGYTREARSVAEHMLEVFTQELREADYIVVPSGSCTTMVKRFYPELFAGDPSKQAQAEHVAAHTFELSQFLVDVLGVGDVGASHTGQLVYHDSCHLLRELGVRSQPRKLIEAVAGAELVELRNADVCCGFGGTFSVKYPEISTALAEEKIKSIEQSGVSTVVACDAGCLMQMAGLLSRRGLPVRCLHIAELLATQEEQRL
jgi:L-lactate dehydrogenase complex protein LldE